MPRAIHMLVGEGEDKFCACVAHSLEAALCQMLVLHLCICFQLPLRLFVFRIHGGSVLA